MVEVSTFVAEFCAMKTAVEMIEALRYKLRVFCIPFKGPANFDCDNEIVTNNKTIPEHRCWEAVAAGTVRISKQGTDKKLALFPSICEPFP